MYEDFNPDHDENVYTQLEELMRIRYLQEQTLKHLEGMRQGLLGAGWIAVFGLVVFAFWSWGI